ncbi:MAG: TetR family transcriptional regulator [Actinobacteria bacterium]|nr:MAG: TetR family transcriptional regulator [Actinomycetota bacterium]
MTDVLQVDGRRAVGDRNRLAILEAAIGVLGAQPDAGIAEVAAAAGVGRATVYRHFASREALIEALRLYASEEARQRFAEARVEEGDPVEALERIVAAMLALGDRYRVIFPQDQEGKPRRSEVLLEPLTRLIARAQATGAIDPGVAPSWVIAALRALMRSAVGEIEARRLARDAAPARVVRTLVRGVGCE